MFVSRRLRVFDDPVLAPLILQTGIPVSAAEELLRTADPEMRQALASHAAAENWTPAEARKAVANAKRNNLVEDDNLETEPARPGGRGGVQGSRRKGARVPRLRDRAQNVVEYGLIIASIAVVVLLSVARFGSLIVPWFAALAGRITTVGT
jgi:Flp pilus assembly pilin Flp